MQTQLLLPGYRALAINVVALSIAIKLLSLSSEMDVDEERLTAALGYLAVNTFNSLSPEEQQKVLMDLFVNLE